MENLLKRVMFPPPGHYVIAATGGVNSMVLLHLLANADQEWRLRVAHVNDDNVGQKLVRDISRVYGFPFYVDPNVSSLVQQYGADGIITAHYYDDGQEVSTETILRPLLGVKKAELVEYATKYRLPWREE